MCGWVCDTAQLFEDFRLRHRLCLFSDQQLLLYYHMTRYIKYDKVLAVRHSLSPPDL